MLFSGRLLSCLKNMTVLNVGRIGVSGSVDMANPYHQTPKHE